MDKSETIKLLPPKFENKLSLQEAFQERKSTRAMSSEALSLQELSNLLWATCGKNRDDGKVTAPLMWDMHVYVAMASGVYSYDIQNHTLVQVVNEDFRAEIPHQGFAKSAPVMILLAIDEQDIESGLKNMMNEAGGVPLYIGMQVAYVSQNIYLYSSGSKLNTVALGWFDRDLLKKKLELPESKQVYLVHPVGYSV